MHTTSSLKLKRDDKFYFGKSVNNTEHDKKLLTAAVIMRECLHSKRLELELLLAAA